jgi:hypothetical protein
MTYEFSRQVFKKALEHQISWKSVQWCLNCFKGTDVDDEANKLFFAILWQAPKIFRDPPYINGCTHLGSVNLKILSNRKQYTVGNVNGFRFYLSRAARHFPLFQNVQAETVPDAAYRSVSTGIFLGDEVVAAWCWTLIFIHRRREK